MSGLDNQEEEKKEYWYECFLMEDNHLFNMIIIVSFLFPIHLVVSFVKVFILTDD